MGLSYWSNSGFFWSEVKDFLIFCPGWFCYGNSFQVGEKAGEEFENQTQRSALWFILVMTECLAVTFGCRSGDCQNCGLASWNVCLRQSHIRSLFYWRYMKHCRSIYTFSVLTANPNNSLVLFAVTNASTWKYHEEVSWSKTFPHCLCESANYQSFSTKVGPLNQTDTPVIHYFLSTNMSDTESGCMIYQFSSFSSWAWQWARFAFTNAPFRCNFFYSWGGLNVTLSGRVPTSWSFWRRQSTDA